MTFLLALIAGLVVVTLGAETLIRGARRGAVQLGLTPLVIGLTVVAFGTSAPEVSLSLFAVFDDQSALALGNLVGSNIFNILFIIGASALITPLIVDQKLVRHDVPILIAASLAVIAMSIDGALGWGDGAILVAALIIYVIVTIRQSQRESAAVKAEYERVFGSGTSGARTALDTPAVATIVTLPDIPGRRSSSARPDRRTSLWWNGLLILIGLALLTVGARALVFGAAGLAREIGLSELVIGLTVLAVGTSVPEIATSLVAAFRGERDIAVGNAIGSSLFNLLFVLGATSLVAPDGMPVDRATLYFDLPIMAATAVACLPIFFTGYRIERWEGVLLLAYYIAYVTYLLLDATGHDATNTIGAVMLLFVLPLTAITLVVLAWRALGTRSQDTVRCAPTRITDSAPL